MTRPLTVITAAPAASVPPTALRLAADGHDLVLGYLSDAEAAEKTTARPGGRGAPAVAVQVDVADPKQVDGLLMRRPSSAGSAVWSTTPAPPCTSVTWPTPRSTSSSG